MRKKLGDILPLLMVLAGLAILLYPTVSNFLVERNSSRAISQYDQAVQSLDEDTYAQMLADARAYNQQLAALAGVQTENSSTNAPASAQDAVSDAEGAAQGVAASAEFGLADAESLRAAYDGLLNLNGDGMMGYLSIPRLDVSMPIYHTVEEPVLQVGAGHMPETSLPVSAPAVHSVLSGHRGLPSAKLFTELDRMEKGDHFFIRILGETFAYQVDSIETVLPHETESLQIRAGEDLCTLVTCTPYGINSHRLLVHAHGIPYVESMEQEAKVEGNPINLSLPHVMLIIALVVVAIALGVLVLRKGARADAAGAHPGAHSRIEGNDKGDGHGGRSHFR